MYKAFGIVSSSGRNIYVDGMQDYRPIGAFSFLGRYRVIDFPISNMTNSDIDRIQVYINNKPRSVVEHLGTGRHAFLHNEVFRLLMPALMKSYLLHFCPSEIFSSYLMSVPFTSLSYSGSYISTIGTE